MVAAPLQDQRGLERRAQHVHGRVAVSTADALQVGHLFAPSAEHAQRRQAAQDVQEEGREGAHLQETPLRDGPGAPPDDDEEEQEQRTREQQHHDGRWVQHQHDRQHQDGHDDRQPASRQVDAHVLLDRFEAAHEDAADLPAAFTPQPQGPQRQQVCGEIGAQRAQEGLGGTTGRQLAQRHAERTHTEQHEGHGQERQDVIERLALQEDPRHGQGDRHQLADQRHDRSHACHHGQDQPAAGLPVARQEPSFGARDRAAPGPDVAGDLGASSCQVPP